MPADGFSRAGLVALALTLGLATSCGGGSHRADPIKIAFITDCTSVLSDREPALAGAELPFLHRGSKPRGTQPSGGITQATIYGKRVQLLARCEPYGDFTTLLGALRQVVHNDGADIVVGPNVQEEGLVVKEYAREKPWVTFSTATQEQSTTLKHSIPNLFRFVPDLAQASAGLGAYAYRTLGWRNAVTVGEDDPAGWLQVAGFVAEFCSLGGNVVKRVWSDKVAQIPAHGVDGVVLLTDITHPQTFMKGWAKRYPDRPLDRWLLVNNDGPLTNRVRGLVGVSTWPVAATAATRDFERASHEWFPGLDGGADFYSYDAMEPVLKALEQVHGDLSDGEQHFQQALAGLTFRAPNGTTTLDARRQAIAPMYLGQVQKRHGNVAVHQIAVVPKVEQTFGGYFGPATPPPGREQPACKRRKPPAWVSSVPTTR